MTPYFYITIAAFLFGAASAIEARRKQRHVFGWFLLGALFGVFALIWILLLPPKAPREIAVNVSIVYPNPLTTKDWYYLDLTRATVGPVSFSKLQQAFRDGEFDRSSYVWSEGMAEWQRVESIDGMEKLLDE